MSKSSGVKINMANAINKPSLSRATLGCDMPFSVIDWRSGENLNAAHYSITIYPDVNVDKNKARLFPGIQGIQSIQGIQGIQGCNWKYFPGSIKNDHLVINIYSKN